MIALSNSGIGVAAASALRPATPAAALAPADARIVGERGAAPFVDLLAGQIQPSAVIAPPFSSADATSVPAPALVGMTGDTGGQGPSPIGQADALLAQLAPPIRVAAAGVTPADTGTAAPAGNAPTDEAAVAAGDLPADADAPEPDQDQVTANPIPPTPVAVPSTVIAGAGFAPTRTPPTPTPPARAAIGGDAVAASAVVQPGKRLLVAMVKPPQPLPPDKAGEIMEAASSPIAAPPFASVPSSAAPVPASLGTAMAALAPASTDAVITHHLDLAQDHAWLTQLAQDITRSADASGHLRFALAPERLGRMTVELAAGADGTAVRMITESEQARRILSDAQPRLVAEAQAQGLRITDTQVALDQRPAGGHRHDAAPSMAGSDGQTAGGSGQGGPAGQGGDRPRPAFPRAQARQTHTAAAPSSAGRHLYA